MRRSTCRFSAVRSFLAALVGFVAVQAFPVDPVEAAESRRIVSIGGSVTEILYAMGEQDRIVAVDTTSSFPADAKALPNVGYMRALAAEGVLSLKPDLILAIEGAGPPPVIEVLKASAISFVEVPEAHSPDGILAKIDAVGAAIGAPEKAEALKAKLRADLDAMRTDIGTKSDQPAILFLLSASGGKPMASGAGTAADAIIGLAGGRNVFAAFDGYKPVTNEAIIAASPDIIVTMNRHGSEPASQILSLPGIELTPAGRNRAVIAMDGLYLLGFGPRTADAVRELAGRIDAITR